MKKTLIMCALAATTMAGYAQEDLGIGIRLENMDTSAKPGEDFYQYADGGWIKNNPLTAEYPRFGSFNVVAENNRKQLKELINELSTTKHERGTIAQKIADIYNMKMDSARMDKDGIKPIMADLKSIENINGRNELKGKMIDMSKWTGSMPFATYLGSDMMDSKNNILEFGQGGLTLGQKDYYLNDDEATVKIREAYKKYIVDVFKYFGKSEKEAESLKNGVMSLETRLAKASKSSTELRDPASNYHKMAYSQFKQNYLGLDWDSYLAANFMDASKLDHLTVGQPEALKEAMAVLNDEPIENIKAWLEWQLINRNTGCLGDELYNMSFDFFGKTMTGQKEPSPRWKRSVNTVEEVLGMALGQMYVEKYFPAENKERMLKLVKNLQVALAERIDAQDWMSDATKAYAKDKLSAFYVKIGYPDKWKDYSSLDIDPEKTLYENMKAISIWNNKDDTERKFNKPVDRDEWFMTPQTVNAYYNPTTNEICFPAGILQYPFFDMSADDAFNYGAIGVVIGHEMTHGFDDQGRQFDKDGNFRDWWAEGDGDKFKERAKVMSDFFSNIEVLPGLNANGELTLGENLADHGGLQVAYAAFKNASKGKPIVNVEGFTPEQRFFIAYANMWAQNSTEEEMRRLTKIDPHSLCEWRVNGALPHIDAWYDAFNIKPSDKLYVPKANRVTIW